MALTAEDLRRRLAAERTTPPRLAYTALGTAGLAMAAIAVSLLATEPALPGRTISAFVAIAAAGLFWFAYAAWVLTTRRVLYARQQQHASLVAVVIAAVCGIGALALRDRAAAPAVVVNVVMVAIALAWHLRARQRVAALEARRRELESMEAYRA
jgi:hypothetical protein